MKDQPEKSIHLDIPSQILRDVIYAAFEQVACPSPAMTSFQPQQTAEAPCFPKLL